MVPSDRDGTHTTRHLISNLDARILADAYGYTISLPSGHRVFPAYLDLNTHVLNVQGDLKRIDNAITLDVVGSEVSLNVDGDVARFDVNSVSGINVTSGDGDDTINVLRTPANVPVQVSSRGTAIVNLGAGHSIQELLGGLTVSNDGGRTTLNVDDSADSASRTITWGSVSDAGASGFSAIVGLAPTVIWYDNRGTRSVSIRNGRGGGTVDVPFTAVPIWVESNGPTTVNVRATGAPLTLVDNGPATVNVGSGGSAQGIRGDLTIRNGQGHTTLNVDDSADSDARTVTLDSVSFFFRTLYDYGSIAGLAPAVIRYDNRGMDGVTINTGRGDTTVNVRATGAPLTLVDNGPATVNVGSGGSAQGITRHLSIVGHGDRTAINVDGSADVNRTVSLNSTFFFRGYTSGSITGLAPAEIFYTLGPRWEATRGATLAIRTGRGSTIDVRPTAVATTVNGQIVHR
jgi:hypothetical protein